MEKYFEQNPYDRCVAKILVKGKKCNLLWYVNDKKVSYMEEKLVEDLINDLKYFWRVSSD